MICVTCGTSFGSDRLSSRYCSSRCKKTSEQKRRKRDGQRTVTPTVTCAYCGNKFQSSSPKARYCQSSCRQSAYRERKKRVQE